MSEHQSSPVSSAAPADMAAILAELERARDAAQAADRAKGDFLAVMSHEIRTPMNAIIGVADLAYDAATTDEQRELLRTLRTNADELMTLINEVLDSSKIEAGQMAIAEERCFISDVLDGVAESMSARAHQKDVELTDDIATDVPVMVMGDAQRLRQIVANFVSNAVKFTHAGSVVIGAEVARASASDLTVHFTVRDTGVGIPADALPRVFERFYQVDSSMRRAYGGTGLGLSISKSLAEMMGGRVWAESVPGAGSTFHLELPFRTTRETPPMRRLSDHGFPGRRVRLVCDDARSQRGMARVFRSLKLDVTMLSQEMGPIDATEDADVAPAPLDMGAPGLLVIDAALGAATANMIAKSARAMSPETVVFVAARPTGVERQVAASVAGATLLSKPLTRRRTADTIGEALSLVPAKVSATVPAAARRAPLPPRMTGGHVLVVDDNPDNRLLARTMLERAGYVVEFAVDGAEGAQKAIARRWDLILSDLEMPTLDGFGMTERIRRAERERDLEPVPVIAVTAHALESIRERSREAGMNDFITKPLHRDTLLSMVARWVDLRPVVLVTDDAPDNRYLVRRMLDGRGYRLLEATNGDEAIAQFDAGRVSLMLLDMSMPGRDGFSTARAIRSRDRGATVPIVALTGYADAEDRQKCLDAGCTGYLTKPVRKEALIQAVDAAIGTSEAAPASEPQRAAPEMEERIGAETVMIDPDIADLVPGFISGRRADAERLRTLASRNDFDGVRAMGHNLKGTGAGYGFDEVSRIGRELEIAAMARDGARVIGLAGEMAVWARAVRWEVGELLLA